MGAGVEVTWLGQAGFLLEAGGTRLLVDAYLSPSPERLTPPAPVEGLGGLAGVLATHEHWDHLDLATWPALAAGSPRAAFVVPEPLVAAVAAALPVADRIRGAVPGEPLTLGDAVVTPVPAMHGVHVADAYTFGRELSGGAVRYLGYVIALGRVRVWHAGDTIAYDGLAASLRALGVDLALVPVNGRDAAREADDIVGNLDASEAADLVGEAGVAAAVPMHYDMFAGNRGDPGRFVGLLRERHPSVSAFVPAPLRPFTLRGARP